MTPEPTDIWGDAYTALFGLDRTLGPSDVPGVTEILNVFLPVLVAAFVVTLVAVPFARWVAIRFDIVDMPDGGRKIHRQPIAYLGGAAVFVGVLAGILGFDLFAAGVGDRNLGLFYSPVPYAVVFGLLVIFATGIFDDIFHWDPRLKLAGQLAAAAGLAATDIGTNAAEGVLRPIVEYLGIHDFSHAAVIEGGRVLHVWNMWGFDVQPHWSASFAPWMTIEGVYYWAGVVFIGLMVLGASNSANLIDGLDGLLTGAVAIMTIGFTVVAVMLAQVDARDALDRQDRGIQIATDFIQMEWMLERPGSLATPNPEATRRLDFTQDGKVDLEDWRAMLEGPDPSSAAARWWDEAWETPEGETAFAKDWRSQFMGHLWVLKAFDERVVDADGVLVFDLPTEGPAAGVGPDVPDGTVDRDDLRTWLIGSEVLIATDRDPLAGTRLIIALALLGACLGFLPYNFNPAVIFLGDAGSLLMGYLCAVLILSLGSKGQTHYVLAGLVIFSLPIMDTVLAIVRRKLAGLPMSAPDKNHIHHMMLRWCDGKVKKAVFALYALNTLFVVVGVVLAATVAFGGARYLLAYGVSILIFGFVGAVSIKAALHHRWSLEARSGDPEE